MYKNKTFIAIIPARGGSKGIPNKNITDVNGTPLIKYTIDAAKKTKYLDRFIVSTDSEEIAEVSKKYGAEVPFLRPKHLATDHAKTIDAIVHVVNELTIRGEIYDYVVLLQPTQPLRQSWHIDKAIEKIIEEMEESLVSVSEVKDHPILYRTIDKQGKLQNLLPINSTVRRQEFSKFYKVNGAIYINKFSDLTLQMSLNDNKLAFLMDKKYDLDIDEIEDLELLRFILK